MFKIIETQLRPGTDVPWYPGLTHAVLLKWTSLITSGDMLCYATVLDGVNMRRAQIFKDELTYHDYLLDPDISELMSSRTLYNNQNNIIVNTITSTVDDTDTDLIKWKGVLGVFDTFGNDLSHVMIKT